MLKITISFEVDEKKEKEWHIDNIINSMKFLPEANLYVTNFTVKKEVMK